MNETMTARHPAHFDKSVGHTKNFVKTEFCFKSFNRKNKKFRRL